MIKYNVFASYILNKMEWTLKYVMFLLSTAWVSNLTNTGDSINRVRKTRKCYTAVHERQDFVDISFGGP